MIKSQGSREPSDPLGPPGTSWDAQDADRYRGAHGNLLARGNAQGATV